MIKLKLVKQIDENKIDENRIDENQTDQNHPVELKLSNWIKVFKFTGIKLIVIKFQLGSCGCLPNKKNPVICGTCPNQGEGEVPTGRRSRFFTGQIQFQISGGRGV